MTAADIESAPQYVVVKYPMKPRTDYDLKIKDDSRFPGAKIDLGQTIVYDGTGAPSAGGQIIVSYGGRLGILTVDAVTGKVTRTQ
jgi:hypothetical protein